jgi:hypothetical protein
MAARSHSPYLLALLRVQLGEKGWSFQRLADAMRWHRDPEWLADVAKLAHEMGLIAHIPLKKRKARRKAKILIFKPKP